MMMLHLLFLCQLALLPGVHAEIRPFTLLLEPASEYIHYVEGFLVAPGFIDLSKLRFAAIDTADFAVDDDEFTKGADDTFEVANQDDDSSNGGGRRRRLDDKSQFIVEGTTLDIAVFHLPSDCAGSRQGCDWIDLGIGARTADGVVRYCCSKDAIDLGLCHGTSYGRLIMDGEKFSGSHRLINIPSTGAYDSHLKFGKFEEKKGSGKYAIILSNCNDSGRPVLVEGSMEWKSRHGYLPGDLFGLMHFYAILFFAYVALLLWYGITMKIHDDASIPIQGWIFATIAVGCVELFFRAGDLFVWNEEGKRFMAASYIGLIVGVLKAGISRCLIVMVSHGWGVIRDDLGVEINRINFLGSMYIVVALIREITEVVAYNEVQKITQEEKDELFDIYSILSLVQALIDVVFYLWIIDSLNATMEYLEGMNQTAKLLRYLRLRSIFLFSILFAVVTKVFEIVDAYDQGIVDEGREWILLAMGQLNTLFVLGGVAILWRPQENAKEYAYVMQLPTVKVGADDDEEGELEMAGVVPSAMDDSDDEDDEIAFKDEPEYVTK